jgi:hypothetical protein
MITRVRKMIFAGAKWTSTRVKNCIDPQSWTAVRNAFSEKMSHLSFNPFKMLVPDILHENELGIWRHLLEHLLRLLHKLFPSHVSEMNTR